MNDGLAVFLWIVAIVIAVWSTIASYNRVDSVLPPSGFTGIFQVLFGDIRFNYFTLRKFVSAVYFVLVMIAVAIIVYGVLSFPVSLMSIADNYPGNTLYDSFSAILIPIVILVVARFILESMIAIIKIAENTSVIASASTKETAS